jgi:hypothetical protein
LDQGVADEDVVDDQCAATAEADLLELWVGPHDLEEVWPLEVLHGADQPDRQVELDVLGQPFDDNRVE